MSSQSGKENRPKNVYVNSAKALQSMGARTGSQGMCRANPVRKKLPNAAGSQSASKKRKSSLMSFKDIPNHSKDPENRPSTKTDESSLKKVRAVVKTQDVISSEDGNVALSHEQKYVHDLVVNKGKNVFFTGSAGTGKSTLLKRIIADLSEKHGETKVAVTASTGLAACNIQGTTIHSFAGCGLGIGDQYRVYDFVMRSKKAVQRWMDTRVLIIDEISMVEGPLFDKLEFVARQIRNNDKPFGGIQLIITGDFMQLPPVADKPIFCFEAKAWAKCVPLTIKLNKVFRQSDQTFVNILNQMREGRITPETEKLLRSLERPLNLGENLLPTQLFALRDQVDKANTKALNALPGETISLRASDTIKDEKYRRLLKEITIAPEVLHIKLGAQVMLIKNMHNIGLVNGSIGFVTKIQPGVITVEFRKPTSNPGEKLPITAQITMETWKWKDRNEDKVLAERQQFPLLLAYALSIHKSQGMTLDFVKVDLAGIFECGQTYVALSRCRSLEGLQVLHFSRSKVMAHSRVVEFNLRLQTLASR